MCISVYTTAIARFVFTASWGCRNL